MSVRGRTYPFRIVVYSERTAKPSTHVVQGDRDSAENRAAEVQAHGTRAEVLLVQGDLRTVVTEHPVADFDPDFDPDGRSYFVRYHLPVTTEGVLLTIEHGTVTAEAGQSLFESDARRAARAFQRAGGSAEIVRGNTVSSVYPALTGQALAGVAEPTTDERLDARITTPRAPRVIFERVRHAADCVSLNLTLLCHLEPRTADANGVMTGNCLTPGARLADPNTSAPVSAEAEVEAHERALDPQRLAELGTEGPLSRQLRAEAEDDDVPDDSCTTGVEHSYDLVHEDDDVRQYRCTSPGCGAETYEDKQPATTTGSDLAERRAAYARDLDRAAEDADDALGGELGRALALLLRHAGKHATQGALDGMLALRVRRVAELTTERALAHRTISRGGPDRRDVDKAALDAYSDRFERSRKLVRDHQAAMRDAVSAVFDTVAAGTPGVLRHPTRSEVAVYAPHPDRPTRPWSSTDGGHVYDLDVAGWLEMAPTGRRFDPTDARPAPAENWLTRNAVYTRTDEIPPPVLPGPGGAAFLPADTETPAAPTGPVDQQHEETDVTTSDNRDPKRKPVQPARTAPKPVRSHGGYGEVVDDFGSTGYSAPEQTGGSSSSPTSDSGSSSSSSSSSSGSDSSGGGSSSSGE